MIVAGDTLTLSLKQNIARDDSTFGTLFLYKRLSSGSLMTDFGASISTRNAAFYFVNNSGCCCISNTDCFTAKGLHNF